MCTTADIVFFGEPTPIRMAKLAKEDFRKCDLLIVAGTSLQVQPFASMINLVPGYVPRMLFNRDPVGLRGDFDDGYGFLFGHEANYRDVCVLGNCDDIVGKFAKQLELYVVPKERGKMTGIQMMKKFIDWSKMQGAQEVMVPL